MRKQMLETAYYEWLSYTADLLIDWFELRFNVPLNVN